MKIVKILLGILVVIVAVVGVLAMVSPTAYDVKREVSINQPRVMVYDYLKMLKNQDNFSAWATKDPAMKKTFKGTDGTVGFVSAWESEVEEVGVGEQEIMKMTEGERIDYELRFIKPFEATDNAHMALSDDGAGTKVEWGFNGNMAKPMNVMMLVGMINFETMLGPQLQEGLDKLKTVMESMPAPTVPSDSTDTLEDEA